MGRYGWRKDQPDQRDYQFIKTVPTPDRVDLRPLCPPIYDQQQLGSCVAQGVIAALQFDATKQCLSANPMLSRLFLYYEARALEGTVASDAGCAIRDAVKIAAAVGIPPETDWPYSDANPGPFSEQPPAAAFRDARLHRALRYERLAHAAVAMESCLASGYPFTIGISVYQSFESNAVAATGLIPLPQPSESLLGGHCMLVVGYNRPWQYFFVRNSWGRMWGGPWCGYAAIPYAYLVNARLADDFWTIRTVSGT